MSSITRPDVNGFLLRPTDTPIPLRSVADFPLAKKPDVTQVSSAADPQDPLKPAREFEALLIGQMLHSAHSSEDSSDPTSDTMWDMAAQQFSKVLADNGGLGLARIITQSFKAPNATNEAGLNPQRDASKQATAP